MRQTLTQRDNMTNFDIQDAVIKKVNSLIAKFEKDFGTDLKEFPVIKFTKKGRVAGTFSWGSNEGLELNFNMVLLKENFVDFINSTVPHEVAHLLTYNCYGVIYTRNGNKSHHGSEWKKMMDFLGAEASRCHSYSIKNCSTSKKQSRWAYTCGCMTHQLSTVRHNRSQRGHTTYSCNKCGKKLVRA